MALWVSHRLPLPGPPCAVSPVCPVHVVPTAPTGRSPASREHTGASLFWEKVGGVGEGWYDCSRGGKEGGSRETKGDLARRVYF